MKVHIERERMSEIVTVCQEMNLAFVENYSTQDVRKTISQDVGNTRSCITHYLQFHHLVFSSEKNLSEIS
jgi:hypothetical protein